VIYVLIIIFVIGFIWFITRYKKHNEYVVNLCSGVNGGGKTFNNTYSALNAYKRSVKKWALINSPTLFQKILHLYFIPYFNNKRKRNYFYKSKKPLLYSNYPILISNGVYSEPLTCDIMLMEKCIPWGSVVVLDEVSKWVNQFEFKESFSKALDEHISYFRHYHGNDSRIFMSDQCSNLVPCQLRYRVNQSVYYVKTKHYLKFIHISYFRVISLDDNIKSVQNIDNVSNLDDIYDKKITFGFKRRYDDLALSNLYYYYDSNNIVIYHESPLKVKNMLRKPIKNYKYKCIDDVIDLKDIKEVQKDEKNNIKSVN
jgi:hypothetical protein